MCPVPLRKHAALQLPGDARASSAQRVEDNKPPVRIDRAIWMPRAEYCSQRGRGTVSQPTTRIDLVKACQEIDSSSDAFTSVYAFSSPTPVRWAASVAQAASSAVMPRPKTVPSSAV